MKLSLLAVVLILSCQSNKTEQKAKPEVNQSILAEMNPIKLNVGIVIVNGVYNSEMMAPYDIFHHSRFHTDSSMVVFTVAPSLDEITTFEGIRQRPDFDFAGSPSIDVLVVPSAEHSLDTDLQNETLINFVREKGNAARYMMSLCDGAFVLAKAGLLDN